MSRVPRIRFKGFEEDWEQRKLGEIAERIVRKNEKLESTLPLTISAQYGLIDQNEFFDKRIASKDVRGYYLIKKGEFAYNKSTSVDAPLGAIKRLDKYNNGVLSTLYILFKIIDNTSTSSDYLVTYYSTDLWHKGIQSIAAEGARNHGLLNIAPNDFFETMLSIPLNVSEQKKVGGFFISLDHLITLHQSKSFGHILEVIVSCTLSWEQRKLEDYLEVSEEKNLNNEYTKENVLSVSGDVGIVNQIEFQGRSFAGILVNNYGVVKTGYVVYTKSPLKNNPYGIIKANKGMDGIVSTLYAIYKPKVNVNSNFVQIYFEQNARMNNYMQPLVNKGAKNDMKISSENALKGNVIFPIRKEQDIIVDFFFKIDHLITLHQSKLEKLQKIKKSMLESMFV